jgi:predicted unusual protein kinase regulating ubiquinone biosynthesis (AarF/ABC1/UbiB family)
VNRFMRGMQGVQLPGHTILLSRALGLLEGLCIDLQPQRTLLEIVTPILPKRLGSRSQVRWVTQRGKDLIQGYLDMPENITALRQEIRQLQRQKSNHVPILLAAICIIAAAVLDDDPQYLLIVAGGFLAFVGLRSLPNK